MVLTLKHIFFTTNHNTEEIRIFISFPNEINAIFMFLFLIKDRGSIFFAKDIVTTYLLKL